MRLENPNETRGTDIGNSEVDNTICPKCGMQKEGWSANDGEGFEREEALYCCEGCAEDTGCVCEDFKDVA